jgi:SIR2-like domain
MSDRDLIYDEVIAQYSAVDVSKAASLYEDLFVRFKAWFSEIAGIGTTIPFFTLNYDVAVETAISKLPVRLVDGLRPSRGAVERRWSPRAFADYKENGNRLAVVLMKLHGSVRWGLRSGAGDGRRVIVELALHVGRDPGIHKHVVLYPTEMAKPIHLEPFRTLYRIFRESLNHASVLFVIGCSLRDQEIRTSISDAMDDNRRLHLVLIGPEADHATTAQSLELDRTRVAATKVRFELSAGSTFMGMLRGFAQSASGITVSDAPRTYRFDVTYKTWPSIPQAIG